jgi:hypothetical protein
MVFYDTGLRAVNSVSAVLSVGRHLAAVVMSPKARKFKEIHMTLSSSRRYSDSRSTYSHLQSLLQAVVEAVQAQGYSRDFAGDRVYDNYGQFYSAMHTLW